MVAGPATDSAVAMTLPPSARQFWPIEGYMKSWVGGASGPYPVSATGSVPGAAASGGAASAGAGWAATAAAAGPSIISGGAGTASGRASGATGAACGTGPTDLAGSMPLGRWGINPGADPAVGTCSVGSAAGASGGDCTNCATESATCREPVGALEFPANAAAAAASSEVAPAGSAAACWITGLNCSIAGRPGNPAAGSGRAGAAGSAAATALSPPKSSAADDPTATVAVAVVLNSVRTRDMRSPKFVGGGVTKSEASLLLLRLK